MTLKVTLIDRDGFLVSAPERHTFTGTEKYEDVMEICTQLFTGVAIEGIRMGRLHSPNVESFEGDPLRVYMKKNLHQPSKTSIYAVQDGTTAPKPKRKKKMSEESTTTFAAGDSEVTNIAQEELTKTAAIGLGGSCDVYSGTWRGTPVALKIYKLNELQNIQVNWRDEVSVHANLRHPNVLPLFGISVTDEEVVVVSELMETTIQKIITTKATKPSTDKALTLAKDIVSGIDYLHAHNVVHGDIKPANVLASNDLKSVKVCDFGLSRIKQSAGVTTVTAVPGTLVYMAPESILWAVKSNFATDVWSLGATIAQLLTGAEPWKPSKGKDMHEEISNRMDRKEAPDSVLTLKKKNRELYNVIKRCFVYDTEERDSVADLKARLGQYLQQQ